MKIVHRICCGVDVHKKNIVATIAVTDEQGVTRYFTATFTTITKDLHRFRAWLTSHNCFDVCMESTDKYWIPVFNIPRYAPCANWHGTDASSFTCGIPKGTGIRTA